MKLQPEARQSCIEWLTLLYFDLKEEEEEEDCLDLHKVKNRCVLNVW